MDMATNRWSGTGSGEEAAEGEALWFRLLGVERMNEAGDWPDKLECCLLIVVHRDVVRLTVDSRLVALERGDVFVGRPGQRLTRMETAAMESNDSYMLFFDIQGNPAVRDGVVRRLGNERRNGVLPGGAAALLPDLCEKAHRHWLLAAKWEKLRSQAAFQEIICHVLQRTDEAPDAGLEAALMRIKQHLDVHYCDNPSMERLADRARISSRHFRRAFKRQFGISATEYVTDLRMSQAKRLMATTGQSVADIARQVGYQDECHFRRTFKAKTGIPPAVYVKNRELRVAACSFPNIGQLLPLRIIPFAAPLDHEWTDAYRRKYHTEVIFPLHHNNEANRKTLLAAKPDRILAIDAYGTAEFHRTLGEIAPVLVIPWRSRGWREHLLMTASFLDRSEEADEWLAAYDERAAGVCERFNAAAERERTLFLMIDRHHAYRWRGGPDGRLSAGRMPFAPMRHRLEPDPDFERIDPEELAGCEADAIVLLLSEDRHSQLTWRALRQSAGWNSLEAVRAGCVRSVAIGPWFEYTAHNHGAILEKLAKMPP